MGCNRHPQSGDFNGECADCVEERVLRHFEDVAHGIKPLPGSLPDHDGLVAAAICIPAHKFEFLNDSEVSDFIKDNLRLVLADAYIYFCMQAQRERNYDSAFWNVLSAASFQPKQAWMRALMHYETGAAIKDELFTSGKFRETRLSESTLNRLAVAFCHFYLFFEFYGKASTTEKDLIDPSIYNYTKDLYKEMSTEHGFTVKNHIFMAPSLKLQGPVEMYVDEIYTYS